MVLNTAHGALDMDPWMAGLRPKGVFRLLGATAEPIAVASAHLITGRTSVSGSAVGSPGMMRRLLSFAAEHGIAATVEVAPVDRANGAFERTRRNAARYRMVLAR